MKWKVRDVFLSYMNDKPIKWYVIANMDLVIVH